MDMESLTVLLWMLEDDLGQWFSALSVPELLKTFFKFKCLVY